MNLRRLPLALLACAVAMPAAGAFHDTLPCTACHSSGGGGGPTIRPVNDEQLCLRCHGGTTHAPDVLRSEAVRAGAAPRAGGRVAVAGGGGAGRIRPEWTGHTLGSTAPPPGFTGTWPSGTRLTCSTCHAVHPNGAYRNLGPDPFVGDRAYVALTELIYSAERVPAPDADVLLTGPGFGDAAARLLSRRERNAMDEFCASCHGGFHGAANTRAGGDGRFVRHPTTGVEFSERTRRTFEAAPYPPRVSRREDGGPEVSCLTCHRAHGTANPFGLVFWDAWSSANGESGAGGGLESLCLSCHRFDD